MEDRLNVALELARQSGTIIKDNFGKTHAVELKGDMSPVTAIDKQINALVAQTLKASDSIITNLKEANRKATGL